MIKTNKQKMFLGVACMIACSFSQGLHSAEKITVENGYNNCASETNGEELFLKQTLKDEPSVVFDVGASSGVWSDLVLKYAPNAEIHAFEPSPTIFKLLKSRKSEDKFFLNQFALSDRNKVANLHIWSDYKNTQIAKLNGLYYRPLLKERLDKEPKILRINTTTVDHYCSDLEIDHIDLLKIDVSGSELDVLKGAEEMIAAGAIKMIQFEYGGCFVDSQATLKEVYERLVPEGYTLYRLVPNGKIEITEWNDDLECFNYSNYVALRS